jgi:hypothetical protein
MINRDQMANAYHREVASCAFMIIDAIQRDTPSNQALACVAVFKLIAERFGFEPQDVAVYASNLMNHADGTARPEFAAIRQYLKEEVG